MMIVTFPGLKAQCSSLEVIFNSLVSLFLPGKKMENKGFLDNLIRSNLGSLYLSTRMRKKQTTNHLSRCISETITIYLFSFG